jgi:hypothetical protein
VRTSRFRFSFPVTEPTTHTNSAVLKGLYSFLEIHSVEEDDLEPGEIDAIKTADVHSPFVGCRARTMERVDTTVLAEVMLCDPGVKFVETQSVFAREDLKVLGLDPTVESAFAVAVGAVAFRHAREISPDLEGYPPAMTGSPVAFHEVYLRNA